jgi:ParB-like nuclease domain
LLKLFRNRIYLNRKPKTDYVLRDDRFQSYIISFIVDRSVSKYGRSLSKETSSHNQNIHRAFHSEAQDPFRYALRRLKISKKLASDKNNSIEAVISLPNLQVTLRKPADLVPWDGNPRTHSDKQIVALMASIKELGFRVPIITNEEGIVLAGHGRLEAAQKLGLTEVPTIVAEGLTKTQQRAYVLS